MSKLEQIQKALDESRANVFINVLWPKTHTKIDSANKQKIENKGGLKTYFFELHKKHNLSSVDVEFRKPNGTSSKPFGQRLELNFSKKNKEMPNNEIIQNQSHTQNVPEGLNGLNGLSMYFEKLRDEGKDFKQKYEAYEKENKELRDKVNSIQRKYDLLEYENKNLIEKNKEKSPIDGDTIKKIVLPLAQQYFQSRQGLNAPKTENKSLSQNRKEIINLTKMTEVDESIIDRIYFVFIQYAQGNNEFVQKIEKLIKDEQNISNKNNSQGQQ
ncbi:hypothetical protein [Flavobacteriaceae bacterium 14752]|uniref:hypothetical protein n=1 Tax=Mesohalobacter salilacus TaxID=2491711 RepID=UPI000F633416|nr:hypothetical protein EIG84_05885 [Flavobacteriaceae bacterium 14752]